MKRRKGARAPKALSYELIPPTSDVGRPMYARLTDILEAHHDELARTCVRIALAWAKGWKPDVDGRLVLGKCKKASELDRELAPYDFVILLNRNFWLHTHTTELQRTAILDHELHHASIAYDEDGEPKTDERGRTQYRIRKHDLEEFTDIPARYGLYKTDIEEFAKAVHRAEARTSGWIGYERVRDLLARIGVEVTLDTIRCWPESQRREVLLWADLRAAAGEMVNVAMSPSMPACLAAAVRPPASGDHATH